MKHGTDAEYKERARSAHNRKVSRRNQNQHGRTDLAQTDGLKLVAKDKKKKKKNYAVIEDQEFDLTRIRRLGDTITDAEIAEIKSWLLEF